jgi:hypothetical protein
VIALLLAAALVPTSAQGALVVEDASGLRALLTSAARYAPSLSVDEVGRVLRSSVGVDLLAEQPEWGLARRGPRTLAFSRDAVGVAAPVASAKSARAALAIWKRARPGRAGSVSKGRLLTASGRGAQALLKMLALPRPLREPLASAARGPAWIFLRLDHPLRAAVLALDASAAGLTAHGVAIGAGALLEGAAPSGCDGSPSACLRAGVGPAGRGAIALALAQLRMPPQEGLQHAARVVERLDQIDAGRLDALTPAAAFDGPAAQGPALSGSIDLAQLDGAVARLNPLEMVTNATAAGAYAAHLLYGALLRNSGPLTLTGDPLPHDAAQIELKLPIR